VRESEGDLTLELQDGSSFRVIIALIAVIVFFVGTGLRKIEAPHANENGPTPRHGYRVHERVRLTADFAGSTWHG
jgi:hypothetical protein